MKRVNRFFFGGLIALTAVLVLLLVVPVFGSGNPDADRLRLTDQTEAFFYGGSQPLDAGVIVQPIDHGQKGCQIGVLSGPLVELAGNSGGGVKGPGLTGHGIGIKSGGSNGTPCSEVSGSERLTIESHHSWIRLELDVQPKGNAWIHVELFNGSTLVGHHELLTGASIDDYNNSHNPDEIPLDPSVPYVATTTSSDTVEACANPSDSGPDSGPNDNCRWFIQPGANFDKIVIYTTVGSVALEGGDDFESFDPTGFGNGDYDSLFFRALSAGNDSYTTDEDVDIDVAAPGVRANDSTIASGVSAIVTGDGPDHGDLTLNTDGSFLYEPDPNYHGPDGFTYHLTDGIEISNEASVSIVVESINDDPEALEESLQATEDMPENYTGHDLATDVDGDPLVISVASATGVVDLLPDGTVDYTPPADVCGLAADTLTFTVSDGNGGTVSGSVDIDILCVNDPPVANADEADDVYAMDERVPSGPMTFVLNMLNEVAPGVLGNDEDTDGDILTVQSHTSTAPGSTLVVNSDGSFTYSPALLSTTDWVTLGAFSYDDTWNYTVTDGNLGTDTATVTITVHRVICSEETVSDTDVNIIGEFTLLSSSPICKRYEVEAHQGSNPMTDPSTVTFTPEGNGGGDEVFSGILTFDALLSPDGSFFVGLEYDPDNDGPAGDQSLLPCIGPMFAGGLVTSATLPAGESWCLAGGSFTANFDGTAFTPVAQVYGVEDPKFSFK